MSRAKARVLTGIVVAALMLVVVGNTGGAHEDRVEQVLRPVPVRHAPGAAGLRPAGRGDDLARGDPAAGGHPAQRIGSLMVNPGGPGGSGVDYGLRGPVL